MGPNLSPNGRSSNQGESRHNRIEKNSENRFPENSRVKEGELIQYNKSSSPRTRKEERRVEPVNPSYITTKTVSL